MFFNIFKKKPKIEIELPSMEQGATAEFYKQWREESEQKATILADYVDISPKQLEQIFKETLENDRLCSAVLAKRTEPDIEYICSKYRVPTKWVEMVLPTMPVQPVIDMACLGDKIGSTREFSNHAPVTKDNLLTPRSTETDDSILTRAVYDAIVENPANPDFRMAYIRSYQENPDADYGGGFAQWAMDDKKNIAGYGSCGNGCVMRISPIVAFYNNYNDVIKYVTASVMPTHNHTESIKAAVVFSGALWMARAGADKIEILDYVKSAYTPGSAPEGYKPLYKQYTFGDTPYTTNMIEKHSLFAGFAIPMVIDHFAHTDNFEDCCISLLAGFCDADTLCSMAGSIYGICNYGIQKYQQQEVKQFVVPMLKDTLTAIYAEADNRTGWQTIISLYEKAIKLAMHNEHCSVVDACRIYLEFNSNYTSNIFKQMDNTASKIEQFFGQRERGDTMQKAIQIKGMSCAHCSARVTKSLESIDGVDRAIVDYKTGNAIVYLSKDVSDYALKDAVEREDYSVVEIY